MENKDASSEEKKEIVEKSQESSKEEAKEETSDKEKQTIEQSAKEVCTLRFGRTFTILFCLQTVQDTIEFLSPNRDLAPAETCRL